ncbi:plac8 onzin related protein 6 [Tachysurus ichikawai]
MCDDCCVATCCGLCSWCQMARELKFHRQPQVFVNAPVNMTFQSQPNTSCQPMVNQSYQPPPMNPGYYPLQPNTPPVYSQSSP